MNVLSSWIKYIAGVQDYFIKKNNVKSVFNVIKIDIENNVNGYN